MKPHINPIRKCCEKLVVFCLLVLAQLFIPPAVGLAEEKPAWFGNEEIAVEKKGDDLSLPDELPPERYNNHNIDCTNKTVATKAVASFTDIETPGYTENMCLVEGQHSALSTTGEFVMNDTKVAGDLKTHNGFRADAVPLPNSPRALSRVNAPNPDTSYLYVYDELGDSQIDTVINNDQTVTYKLKEGTVREPVKRLANANERLAVRSSSLSVSQDGNWAVADARFDGMARIHIPTKEVLYFEKSFDDLLQTAISRDGNLALVALNQGNFFKIYDLSSCGAPIKNFISTCASRDLLPIAKEKIPGFTGAGYFKFLGDYSFQAYAGRLDEHNVHQVAKYVFSAPNAPGSTLDYLALGDSFASGEGAYSYKLGTDVKVPLNKCHISSISYPYQIGLALGMDSYESIACSGAKMIDMNYFGKDTEEYNSDNRQSHGKEKADDKEILDNFLSGYRVQKNFVSKYLPKNITVSIFGNDAGFGNIVKGCLDIGTCYDTAHERMDLVQHINSQFDDLVRVYVDLKSASPNSRIFAIGYPELVNDVNARCGLNVPFSHKELIFFNQLTTYLNSVIQRAAAKAGGYYVDVQNALNDYRLCAQAPDDRYAANGLVRGDDVPSLYGLLGKESFHPNAFGHELYTKTILEKTGNFSVEMPAEDTSIVAPTHLDASVLLGGFDISELGYTITKYSDKIADEIFIKSSNNRITAELFKAGSDVKVWLQSDPVELGNFIAGSYGGIDGLVNIPASVPAGWHTLHILGVNNLGQPLKYKKVVYVAESEDDLDGDGIPNSQERCLGVLPSGIDVDGDGIDDACDGVIFGINSSGSPVTIPDVGDSNSSDFLFQSGGGLQSQSGNLQSAGGTNSLNLGMPLAGNSGGPSRQDLLGEGLKVGEVNFDPSQGQTSSASGQIPAPSKSFDLTDPVFLAVAAIALLTTYFLSRKFIR